MKRIVAPVAALVLLLFAAISVAWPARTPRLPAPPPEEPLPTAPLVEAAGPEAVYRPERGGFRVAAGPALSPYRITPAFVLPGDTLHVRALPGPTTGACALRTSAGLVRRTGPNRWTWTAPYEPGLHRLTVQDQRSGEEMYIHAFVLVPFDHRGESLNGYRLGRYMAQPLRGDPAYLRPRGFAELTEKELDAAVSPHFRLGQFVAKQQSGYPKYLILRAPLIVKLERILEAVNAQGIAVRTLHVMSGFRTPYYNQSIGNETRYSRHLYGDAADVFVDADGDDNMDDLNGDGAIDTDDARTLAQLVETLAAADPDFKRLEGGLGIYPANSEHGPFIHVDTRGTAARW